MMTLMTINAEQIGIASHYSIKCNGGTHTASGIPLNDSKFTAAHKSVKLGSLVRVTNLNNNKEVLVKIIDRGPYITGRIIDVSQVAAEALGFKDKGLTKVKIKVVNPPKAIIVKEPTSIKSLRKLLTKTRNLFKIKQ